MLKIAGQTAKTPVDRPPVAPVRFVASCGCGWDIRGSDTSVFEAAQRHWQETGHKCFGRFEFDTPGGHR